MIERGELRLPEMQRRYVWRSTRVRDLLDSLYRGYPSGAILLWETNEAVPLQDMAVRQQSNPYQSTRLFLDGPQRLTDAVTGQPLRASVTLAGPPTRATPTPRWATSTAWSRPAPTTWSCARPATGPRRSPA